MPSGSKPIRIGRREAHHAGMAKHLGWRARPCLRSSVLARLEPAHPGPVGHCLPRDARPCRREPVPNRCTTRQHGAHLLIPEAIADRTGNRGPVISRIHRSAARIAALSTVRAGCAWSARARWGRGPTGRRSGRRWASITIRRTRGRSARRGLRKLCSRRHGHGRSACIAPIATFFTAQ